MGGRISGVSPRVKCATAKNAETVVACCGRSKDREVKGTPAVILHRSRQHPSDCEVDAQHDFFTTSDVDEVSVSQWDRVAEVASARLTTEG